MTPGNPCLPEPEPDCVVSARSLVKQYKNSDRPALNDFSLDVQQGEFFGLLGPNGAGKTTAISILTGLFPADSGSVRIKGMSFQDQEHEIKRILGLVPQDIGLYDTLTARENLNFFGKLCNLSGQKLAERIQQGLEFARLTEHARHQVATFSTGMKQRLGIALALLPDSEFIILDEPTNGLDPGGIVEIRTIIREYNRRYNTTIILTSHMLGEIEQICHDIALINHGRLAAFGKIEDLLHREKIIVVQCDRTEEAASILRKAEDDGLLPLERLLIEDRELHLQVGHDCAAEINRLLVSQGIMVERLTLKQKRLEEFFLEATTTEKMPCGAMSATK